MSRRPDMTQAEAEKILDLPERYGKGDLRQAFKALAQEYHPDNAARNGISQKFAQQHMIEVNRAYATLKRLFDANPTQTIHRDLVGGAAGSKGVGVHFAPSGDRSVETQVDDSLFWDEDGNPRSAVMENEANAAADAPGHGLRRTLLGPVLLRLVFIVLLGLVWWRTFPLLPDNRANFDMSPTASLSSLVAVLIAVVYPSYFLLYEVFSGGFSGTVREVINGIVSNATHVHVEVRRKGSYRSSLSGLVRDQVYGLLELPLAALSAVRGMDAVGTSQIVCFVVAGVLVVDALLGFFGTGVVVSVARWLSDLIEKHYVTMRMNMLKRCGQWASGRHGR